MPFPDPILVRLVRIQDRVRSERIHGEEDISNMGQFVQSSGITTTRKDQSSASPSKDLPAVPGRSGGTTFRASGDPYEGQPKAHAGKILAPLRGQFGTFRDGTGLNSLLVLITIRQVHSLSPFRPRTLTTLHRNLRMPSSRHSTNAERSSQHLSKWVTSCRMAVLEVILDFRELHRGAGP